MKKIIYYCFAWLFVLLLPCCERDINSVSNEFQSEVVVEGHIEQGEYPIVYLTRNIPYYVNIDSTDLIYVVLKQAKVTVSDGVNSEILTLQYDDLHFPPFYYQGTEITGQVGKTYFLTIVYGKDTLTATTTIPSLVKPDSAWLQPQVDNPEKCQLFVKIHDDPLVRNYYRTFTRIPSIQKTFYPTLIANFQDKLFDGLSYTFQLSKGPESYLDLNQKDYLFDIQDTVLLKFCTLDDAQYHYWESYQLELLNGSNPFATSFHSIKSNIYGKGTGIWGGYGVSVVQVTHP